MQEKILGGIRALRHRTVGLVLRSKGAIARMPGLRHRFPYSPQRWAPVSAAWLAAHPEEGAWIELHPPAILPLTPPRHIEPAAAWTYARSSHPVPGAALAVLPQARYICRRGFGLVARGQTLLGDLSHDDSALVSPHSLMSYVGRNAPQTLSGQLAVIHTPFASGNYAHWLLDCLPRLLLLKQHYADFAQVRHFVFEHEGHAFQTESLALIGLRPEQIIQARPELHLTAEVVVSPSQVQAVFHNQPWAIELLRQAYLPRVEGTGNPIRRIFVSRQNARGGRITNFAQVVPMLKRHNLTIIDPAALPWQEQVRLFAGAELVVAPHGAGLANLVFVPAGTPVVELCSPAYYPAFFWELCSHRQLPYWMFFGLGAASAPAANQMAHRQTDITVDIARLDQLLRAVS